MLQIRLSKGLGADGGASKLSGSDNVTVSCPDHLVLADLPVAKGLGTVSNVKVVKTVGRKARRKIGDKVHFCLVCDFPIAIYGRLSPCEHAFCLSCARSEPSCYLCDERIQKIQTIKMLEGIFICGAPHCLRSFLKRPDFELHIKEAHSDLLQPVVEKEEAHQRDISTAKPVVSDSQAKQPLHADPQALSRSLSAPTLQVLQQPCPMSESPSLRSQTKSVPVSPVMSPPEVKQPQQIQSRGSSSGGKQQDHSKQQTQQRQPGYQQLHDHQSNPGTSPQQQYQVKQQGSEKQPYQSPPENSYRQYRGEIHHSHPDKLQSSFSGRQHRHPQERPQPDGSHPDSPAAYQALQGNQPQRPPAPMATIQPGMPPPIPNHPFPHSYPMQPEVQPHQQSNPNFDPSGFGPPMDGFALQTGLLSSQENNQRIPIHAPFIPEGQENCHISQHMGTSGFTHEAISAIPGPHEGYIHPDRLGPFSHFQGDFRPALAGIPMQLPPQGMGMGFDQSSHYQDVAQVPIMPPLPKRGKHQDTPAHGEAAADTNQYEWGGGGPNFDMGHGYGGWAGP
eukprot:Gb_24756 [translate_table: standard]